MKKRERAPRIQKVRREVTRGKRGDGNQKRHPVRRPDPSKIRVGPPDGTVSGVAGLVGALVGSGVPEHEAKYYHDEFEAGRTIVTVNADGRYDEAANILRMAGGYDMSKGRASVANTV